jgi:hypothetical protein
MRQMVVTFPKRIRYYLEKHPALHRRALFIITAVLTNALRSTCPNAPPEARPGALSFIQRFGSFLNPHIHYHLCLTDGLFHLTPSKKLHFYETYGLSLSVLRTAEEKIRTRLVRLLQRRGHLSKLDADGMLQWPNSGFSLNGEVRINSEDRAGLERLVRYCARPPFASENLTWVRPGTLLLYRLPKEDHRGRVALHLNPLDLIERLAALIPPPRIHAHRYHGVLAPNSPLRKAVTAFAQRPIPHHSSPLNDFRRYLKQNPVPRSTYKWAELLARIYEVLPLQCPSCGGRMNLTAFVTAPSQITLILSLMGLPTEPPPLDQARGPPQLELNLVYREDIDLLVAVDADEPFPEQIAVSHKDGLEVVCDCSAADDPFPDQLDPPHLEEPEANYSYC